MSDAVVASLDDFIRQYMAMHQDNNKLLQIEYDSDWPSPCYVENEKVGQLVQWRPVKRDIPADFSDIEHALDLEINAQLKCFFGSYWSDPLNASTTRGKLQLLLPWNEDDLARLQQNLIGHVLMKRRLGQPETLFFAVTDEEDFIISVDNGTGNVVLEQVGLLPSEVLAEDLNSFILQLSPVLVGV